MIYRIIYDIYHIIYHIMYYIILRVYMLNNYSVDQWPQLLSSRAAYFPLMLHPKVKRAVDINSSL